ncbi:hypothetical protein Tco_0565576 [Tanacetum coccineum]
MWSQVRVSYDKHALWGISHWGRIRQQFYRFAVNRESARDVYSKRKIIAVTKLEIIEWHNYKHLDWITIRRDADKLHKFKEGDFKRLHIQDIDDMLLLLVQGKRVEDLQLGVKSYQKKLNLTKPDTYRSNLKQREAYSAYSNPRGFIYQNKDKKNRLMRIDELHKFSNGTLNNVRTALNDRLKGIQMKYLPQTIWRQSDRDKAAAMIQAIDKQLKTRRIMPSLEKFIGGRPYEEHAEFDESDTHVLERFNTSAGNPVKEILLKLNLPDHMILKDGGKDSDDKLDDGEVLNELDEFGNAGNFYLNRIINSIDEDDLAFPCMIGFRKFVAYFDPFLPMNIITRKAYNIIMVEGLESTRRNLVAIVRNVYVFIESFIYVMDFMALEDIGEFIVSDMSEVMIGRSRRNNTKVRNVVSGSKAGDGVHQDKKDDDSTFWDTDTQVYGNLNLGNSNSAPAPKSSFAEVVTEKPVQKSMFRTLLNDERVESADVVLPLDTLTVAQQRYANSLIGFFVGKNVAFTLVQNYVTNTWSKLGFQTVIKDEDGFFFFKFDSLNGLEQVRILQKSQEKWLKPDKHGNGNGRAPKKPGESYQKSRVVNSIHSEEAHPVTITDCHASNPCELRCDLTAKISLPMIKGMKGRIDWERILTNQSPSLSLTKDKIGKPVMLDAFTSNMCADPWGRISYARVLIEVSAGKDLKQEVIMKIPEVEGTGHINVSIQVEYEWKPSLCNECHVFGHSLEQCLKRVVTEFKEGIGDEGFTKVNHKRDEPQQKALNNKDRPANSRSDETKSIPIRNYFDFLNVEDTRLENAELSHATSSFTNDPGDDDDEEIEEDYVEDLEVSDVNSTGLRFTWNQKPKGDDGILKKIDRIMENLEFNTTFVVVKRLKLLRKPLRKLLRDHGNLHDNVTKLRHELDEAQKALDVNPNNLELREEEVVETDIQEKDEKSSQKRQNRARERKEHERKVKSKPKSQPKSAPKTQTVKSGPTRTHLVGPAGNLSLLSFVNHDPTYMVKTLGDHSNPRVQVGEARIFIAKRQDEGN